VYSCRQLEQRTLPICAALLQCGPPRHWSTTAGCLATRRPRMRAATSIPRRIATDVQAEPLTARASRQRGSNARQSPEGDRCPRSGRRERPDFSPRSWSWPGRTNSGAPEQDPPRIEVPPVARDRERTLERVAVNGRRLRAGRGPAASAARRARAFALRARRASTENRKGDRQDRRRRKDRGRGRPENRRNEKR